MDKCQDHIIFYFISRIIIDGPGAGTVFSGHKPLVDELYTLTNHYVSGREYTKLYHFINTKRTSAPLTQFILASFLLGIGLQ